jgi:isoleucyl-tRNA synthetase
LSSFYLDILKDRLYTYPRTHPARRSAQTVLMRLADHLCRLMAPVFSFTAEEIWQQLELLRSREAWAASSVHTQCFPEPLEVPRDEPMLERWDRFIKIREEVNKALELARAAKRIGTSLQARVVLETPDEQTREFLSSFGDGLRFLLITSAVEFGEAGADAFRSENVPGLAVGVLEAQGQKCGRCWNYTTDVGANTEWPEICGRCATHVDAIGEATEHA